MISSLYKAFKNHKKIKNKRISAVSKTNRKSKRYPRFKLYKNTDRDAYKKAGEIGGTKKQKSRNYKRFKFINSMKNTLIVRIFNWTFSSPNKGIRRNSNTNPIHLRMNKNSKLKRTYPALKGQKEYWKYKRKEVKLYFNRDIEKRFIKMSSAVVKIFLDCAIESGVLAELKAAIDFVSLIVSVKETVVCFLAVTKEFEKLVDIFEVKNCNYEVQDKKFEGIVEAVKKIANLNAAFLNLSNEISKMKNDE